MKKHLVISIIGGTIWGNRGAEAMLVTTIGRIRKQHPTAHFNIFSYYAGKDEKLVSDPKINIINSSPSALVIDHFFGAILLKLLRLFRRKHTSTRFLAVAQAIMDSDFLLDIGGITFSDGREKFLPFNILTIWPAMILGVPVVKLAQALGPFDHHLNRIPAKFFLSRCKKVFVRGEQSYQFVRNLGLVEEKTEPAADIAFLFTKPFSLSTENHSRVQSALSQIHRRKNEGKRMIVLSPSILVDTKLQKKGVDYADIFLSAMRQLKNKDYFFVFLPNSTREASLKKHNNDILLIEKMRDIVNHQEINLDICGKVDWIDYDINTASIREIVKHAYVLVTSRYHAMISGLALSIPTIVIGWGHKYHETMRPFGLSEFVMDVSDSNFDLVKNITFIEQHYVSIQNKMKTTLPHIQNQAEIQFQYLDRKI